MNPIIKELIADAYPEDTLKAEIFLKDAINKVLIQLHTYSDFQYKLYKHSDISDPNRANPEILGRSDGADECIRILQEFFDISDK